MFTGFVFVKGNQGSLKYPADVDSIGEVGAGEGPLEGMYGLIYLTFLLHNYIVHVF
jgi:hypothetical protein